MRMRLQKRALFLLPLFFCILIAAHSRAEEPSVRRALLIGCDHFLTQASTEPAAARNVAMLSESLLTDAQGYERILLKSDSVADADGLRAAVQEAFAGVGDGDVSLIYIATHGLYSFENPLEQCALVLSDGVRENRVTALALKEILDAVPGKKVLILDACHSGAFVGKGMSYPDAGPGVFADPDYRVLCSAGGSEDSWYWHSEDDGDPNVRHGASYFATVLSHLLRPSSPADVNRDGRVTLSEMLSCLRRDYAASTPQAYPENDDFVLYFDGASQADESVIRSLQLDSNVITSADPSVRFTFAQTVPSDVYYEIVYRRDNAWDFAGAQMIADRDTAADAGTPGMKRRELTLAGLDETSFGYLMLLVITKPEGHAELQASALISVQSSLAAEEIECLTDRAFTPGIGQEASILILHSKPCSLSVAILDPEGKAIRYLGFSEPSRPQGFDGTSIVWDGKKTDGTPADPGLYTVRVTALFGRTVKTLVAEGPQLLP